MADVYTRGSVEHFSGVNGLLDKLLSFVTGHPGTPGRDWTVELNENTKDSGDPGDEPFGSACKQVVLKNIGLSGSEEVLVGIREWKYIAGNAWGWDLNCYLSWQAGILWNWNKVDSGLTAYNSTWERYTNHPMLPLFDDTMYYWFYSNRQRIIVWVKVSSNYESCYLGFGNRFGSPSQYPYPLLAIGSMYGNYSYSYMGGYHTSVFRPYRSTSLPSPIIVNPSNNYNTAMGSQGNHYFIPTHDFVEPGASVKKTPDSKVVIQPIYVVLENDTLMSLDDVRWSPCIGIQSEDTITIGGDTWRIFQDAYRNDWQDFGVVKEETGVTMTTTTSSTTSSTASSSTMSTTSSSTTTTTV